MKISIEYAVKNKYSFLESTDYNTAASVYKIHLYSGNFRIIKRITPILFSYTTPFYGIGKFFYAPDVKKLFTGESLLHFFYQFALSSTATTISSGTNLEVPSTYKYQLEFLKFST